LKKKDSFSLIIRSRANNDIQLAVRYYSKISPSLGERLKLDLLAQLEYIQNNPLLFQVRYKEVRMCFLKWFPFGIHYRVLNFKIEILAVIHTHKEENELH
jgi:plasmid stabilization system protein ParE